MSYYPKTYKPDSIIRRFAALIDGLPKAARHLWDTAKIREFNVGVEAGLQNPAYEMVLSSEAVEAAAKLNARIGFTVYATVMPKKFVRKKRPSVSRERQ